MASTPQTAATTFAAQVISINQQFLNLYAQILPLVAANTDQSYMTTVAALPTAATNADGTVSGTPDGSPNSAHPITVPASAPLNKSSAQISTALQNLVDFKAFMENTAVAAGFRRSFAQAVQ